MSAFVVAILFYVQSTDTHFRCIFRHVCNFVALSRSCYEFSRLANQKRIIIYAHRTLISIYISFMFHSRLAVLLLLLFRRAKIPFAQICRLRTPTRRISVRVCVSSCSTFAETTGNELLIFQIKAFDVKSLNQHWMLSCLNWTKRCLAARARVCVCGSFYDFHRCRNTHWGAHEWNGSHRCSTSSIWHNAFTPIFVSKFKLTAC